MSNELVHIPFLRTIARLFLFPIFWERFKRAPLSSLPNRLPVADQDGKEFDKCCLKGNSTCSSVCAIYWD